MSKPDGTTNVDPVIIESGQHNPDSRPDGTTTPTAASPTRKDKGLSDQSLIPEIRPLQPLTVLTILSLVRNHSDRTIVPHPPVPPPQHALMRTVPRNLGSPLYPRWRTTVRLRGRASGHTAHTRPMDDEKDPTEAIEEHDARLDAVEGFESYLKEHVIPRIDELETALDEKNDRINDLEATVASLQHKLETLDGLADDEQSTPEKRAVDLARAMIRQAEQKSDGRVAKYYKEVKETLATLGHESIHDPQAYTAMDDIANASGFGTMTITREGREVDAVYVNLAELDEDQAVNEIKNEQGSAAAENAPETTPTTT